MHTYIKWKEFIIRYFNAFWKTSYFTFIKFENGKIKGINVIKSTGKHNGGSKAPAEIILDSRANVLICGGLGSKALYLLRNDGVEVFSGTSGKVKEIFKEWKMGMLPVADKSSCNEKSC